MRTSIGSTALADPAAGGLSSSMAEALASRWAMIRRFGGSAPLLAISAHRLLAMATASAAALCLYVASVGGVEADYAALAIGLFNSIMCPTIFSLTLERSTASDRATSELLHMAIVGDAFLPLMAGAIRNWAVAPFDRPCPMTG